MIGEVTGIRKIRMLYLQLLYRCNLECDHCFHGKRLQHADAFTTEQAINPITLMREQYGTEAVTLLGGEPFVYKDLAQVVRHAKEELGQQVEICTNGYLIERRLTEIAPHLDLLRVSLEGISSTNDRIRKVGSYQSALEALSLARRLGVPTGVTTTVTSQNINEVLPLAHALSRFGVRQLKLHHLRAVGNAAERPELLVTDPTACSRLREELRTAELSIEVIVDEDLSEHGAPKICVPADGPGEIERIEADPRGALTMSCKAVGKDSHAFWYEKSTNHRALVGRPRHHIAARPAPARHLPPRLRRGRAPSPPRREGQAGLPLGRPRRDRHGPGDRRLRPLPDAPRGHHGPQPRRGPPGDPRHRHARGTLPCRHRACGSTPSPSSPSSAPR
ncbi:radical SAM protein [Streptomyces sp. NPDC002133]|uniref:radical SAM protein n=1 Tax=Streptomyces sp. NPDC002133 TaxID=3154409 RepID=UPI003328D9EA